MLSMLKLLTTTLLLSSVLLASGQNKKIEDFLEDSFSSNPNVITLKVKAAERNLKKFLDKNSTTITTGSDYDSDYISSSPIYYPR